MKKRFFVFFVLTLMMTPAFILALDKKTLDHSVYDDWKNVERMIISDDGEWISYEINPQQGNGWLYFSNPGTNSLDSVSRGYEAQFSPAASYVVFKIKAPEDSTRKAKIAKKKKDQLPKDSLGIWKSDSKSLLKEAKLKSFKLPEKDADWFAYLLEMKKEEKKDTSETKEGKEVKEEQKEEKKEKKSKKKKAKKSDLKPGDLIIQNPMTSQKHTFSDVTDYFISKNGALVSFTTTKVDSVDSTAVFVFYTNNEQVKKIFEAEGISKNISIDEQGTQLAFIFSPDTAKNKIFSLYYWNKKQDQSKVIVDTLTSGMPKNWSVCEHGELKFSPDGSKLYFGTALKPEPVAKDTIPDDEKVKVDIWNWRDSRLQPQQLAELEKDQKRAYAAVYHINNNKMVQLCDEKVADITYIMKGDGKIALGITAKPYEKLISWEWPPYKDVYTIDVNSGAKELILQKKQFGISLSPSGKYITWYEPGDSSWYAYSIPGKKISSLTKKIPVNFYDELHDIPCAPGPYGISGWLKDDQFVLINDRFDIWKIDPQGKKAPVNFTNSYGREKSIQFRYINLDREKIFINPGDELLLKGFHEKTKAEGYYVMKANATGKPGQVFLEDCRFEKMFKAKHTEKLIWTKGSFSEYPDLWYSDLHFKNPKKLTFANPQQQNYLWGTVEMVNWIDFNGNELQGLLYKPENFDPQKKYPMIVYFYEKTSDYIHKHYVPRPSASIIYPSYYASNGYIIFIPDISYGTGHPGNDAYNAIVSGTMALLQQYDFIDKQRLGLQGQSWGGYQVAYLVTKTNLFRAAMAGAPVSNMTSAYGGIRWKTGLSRMFQYEQSQSRIGGTLWEKREYYIENSPVFFANDVQTPLLMMSNDNDGAVPWYQGIEMFVALRRLNKPVWLLSYNGEEHNLKQRANKKDLSIRMQQFFDYYLKDAPTPAWMEMGIPAIEKGKNLGYELIDNE